MSQNCSKIISMAYLWICGAKSRSTPVSPTTVPDLLLSIRAVMWSFSPKHSNDSPSESDEHCDDFVDGSMKMITREISDKNVCFYIFVYKTIFSSRPPNKLIPLSISRLLLENLLTGNEFLTDQKKNTYRHLALSNWLQLDIIKYALVLWWKKFLRSASTYK